MYRFINFIISLFIGDTSLYRLYQKALISTRKAAFYRQIALLALETLGGFTIKTCNDGTEAIAKIENFAPQLLLFDVMMPNMDGYGLTTALRERGYTGKIVGLTAATIGLETDQLITAGADATLSKPVDIKKLCSLVLAQERV